MAYRNWGTDGSNPSPSSSESVANSTTPGLFISKSGGECRALMVAPSLDSKPTGRAAEDRSPLDTNVQFTTVMATKVPYIRLG